ncbi:MAG: hypothetical protein Q9163_004076 [Psora crenata]
MNPPPPPPHGNTGSTRNGLPDGSYDIFIVPPHSSGGGFIYFPSLQTNRNSFLAGAACALLGVMIWSIVAPAFKDWMSTVAAGGGISVVVLLFVAGIAGWAWGKTQVETGGSGQGNAGGGPKPRFTGHTGTGPMPGFTPQPEPGPPPSWQRTSAGAGHGTANPGTGKNEWEKAREDTRRKEEARKKAEELKKKREADERERMRQQEKEAREREAREAKEREAREAREREAREAREREERERIEKEVRERLERAEREKKEKEDRERAEARERLEREERERKEKEERERLEKEEWGRKDKEERERLEKEERERNAKEAQALAEKEARERRLKELRERRERELKEKKEKEAREKREKEARERREKVARERREREAQEKREKDAAPNARPASPNKIHLHPTAKTATDEASSYSYRPYDTSNRPGHKPASASSLYSESSYAPSQSTSRTTPPPSHRGPYRSKDPDKILIKAVYSFNSIFTKTPIAKLVSGMGSVTDGLILRITTEGLFIDDDVRGVPQREWDVKAWTLKLVEVWCPHLLALGASSGSTLTPRAAAAPSGIFGKKWAPKAPTDAESETFLETVKRACKPCLPSIRSRSDNDVASQSGQLKGLHVLRASIRDTEGKRYVVVLDEQEGWKVAVGLQRLRRGTQVRALGVSGIPLNETKAILENMGWI